jgi:hypothetical protein
MSSHRRSNRISLAGAAIGRGPVQTNATEPERLQGTRPVLARFLDLVAGAETGTLSDTLKEITRSHLAEIR